MHTDAEWMYNISDKIFFHIKTNTVLPVCILSHFYAFNFQESSATSPPSSPEQYFPFIPTINVPDKDCEDDDIDIDLFKDLVVVSSQSKGMKETDCEDRILEKFKIPLEYINSSASCVMIGCLDGHGGSNCVEYITKQLPVSILSVIRNPTKRKFADSETIINL